MVNNPLTTTELPKYEVIEYNGRQARRYKDGSIRDEKGRMLTNLPGTEDKVITAQNAPALALLRVERKRQRVQAGANAAIRERFPDSFDGIDDDYIEAIAQQVTYKALDKLDPKQVDAARFIFSETGVGEKQQAENPQVVTHVHQMDAATVALLERIARAQASDVIDAETAED